MDLSEKLTIFKEHVIPIRQLVEESENPIELLVLMGLFLPAALRSFYKNIPIDNSNGLD